MLGCPRANGWRRVIRILSGWVTMTWRRCLLTPLAGAMLVVARLADIFATTSAAPGHLLEATKLTLTMATWFLGRLASKMRRKTVTTTTPPSNKMVRDIGMADRGPTDNNHGVQAFSTMAREHGDKGGVTQGVNRLMNFKPEPKITHKRGRNIKYFPMSD